MTKIQNIIIENLKNYRKSAGLSQAKLAEKCNLSTSFIAEIEMGRSVPSIKTLETIATALRVEPYQLLIDKENITAPTKEDLLNKLKNELTDSMNNLIINIIDKYRDKRQ